MPRAVARTAERELTARNVVAACCAASAGVHAALVPEHLEENALLGTGFAVAAVLLFASTLALSGHRAASPLFAPAIALLLVALVGAYGLSRTVGLTFIGAEVEAVDGVGVATQVVQVVALAAAIALTNPASALTAVARGKETRTCDSLDP
jgi:drug/metabolite transporter (DMT)-like permease